MWEWFKTKEIVSVCLDSKGSAYGIFCRYKDGDTTVEIAATAESALEDNAWGNLKKVLKVLNPDDRIYTILCGSIKGEIFFNMQMPKLGAENLKKALDFEIPVEIPYRSDEIIWSIQKENYGEKDISVTIWVFPEREWEAFKKEIIGSGIKIDCFISPFICDAECGSLFFKGIDDSYCMRKNGNGLRDMIPVAEPEKITSEMKNFFTDKIKFSGDLTQKSVEENCCENYHPAFVVSISALRGNFKDARKYLPVLPVEIIPQRFKELKTACALLALSSCILLAIYCVRTVYDSYSRLAEIRTEKAKIAKVSAKLKSEMDSHKDIDATIKKIADASGGNPELLQCLHFMTETIPDNIWLADFNSNNDKIDLVLKTGGDGDIDQINWEKNGVLGLENIRKKRNNDGTTDIFVKLVYNKDKASGKNDKKVKAKVVSQ